LPSLVHPWERLGSFWTMEAGLEYEGSKETKKPRQRSKWLQHLSRTDIDEELNDASFCDVDRMKEQFKAASRPKKLPCPLNEADWASPKESDRSHSWMERSPVSPHGKITSLAVSGVKAGDSKKEGEDEAAVSEKQAARVAVAAKDDLVPPSEAGQGGPGHPPLPANAHWKVSSLTIILASSYFVCHSHTCSAMLTGACGGLARCRHKPVTLQAESCSLTRCTQKR
jgi:hypothetical protein